MAAKTTSVLIPTPLSCSSSVSPSHCSSAMPMSGAQDYSQRLGENNRRKNISVAYSPRHSNSSGLLASYISSSVSRLRFTCCQGNTGLAVLFS